MSTPVIDVHTHLLPDLSGTSVDGVQVGDDGFVTIDGHRLGLPALYDASALSERAVRNGLDEAWVSSPPPSYRPFLGQDEAAQWVRALNDGMLARTAGHANLRPLLHLPLDHPELAVAVAREHASTRGVAGWTASAGGSSVALDSLELQRLWQLLEQDGRPLLLHPGESPDARLADHYLTNLLGNPVETAVAVGQLLLGGVLDRHPGLRIVLVHCAGVVPSLIGRWAKGVDTGRPGIRPGTTDPRVAIRSVWSDCLAHHPAVVDLAIEVMGADRLVLGSDYPFPMGVDDPHETIAHLEPDVRDRIARNAGRHLSESRP